MYCKNCGDIVFSQKCKRCGGPPIESIVEGSVARPDKKDPWSSTYLEKRFQYGAPQPKQRPPVNSAFFQDPIVTAIPSPNVNAVSSGIAGQSTPPNVLNRSPYNYSPKRASVYRSPLPIRPGARRRSVSDHSLRLSAILKNSPTLTSLQRDSPQQQQQQQQQDASTPTTQGSPYSSNMYKPRSLTFDSSPTITTNSPSSSTVKPTPNLTTATSYSPYTPRPSPSANPTPRPLAAHAGSSPLRQELASNHRPNSANFDSPGLTDNNLGLSKNLLPSISTAQRNSMYAGSPLNISTLAGGGRGDAAGHMPSQYTSPSRTSAAHLDFIRNRARTLPNLDDIIPKKPCVDCSKELRFEEQRQFASKPGLVYCSDCYNKCYSKGLCAACKKIVLTHGRPWVQRGDKVWHKLCLRCHICDTLILDPQVEITGTNPTCEDCRKLGGGGGGGGSSSSSNNSRSSKMPQSFSSQSSSLLSSSSVQNSQAGLNDRGRPPLLLSKITNETTRPDSLSSIKRDLNEFLPSTTARPLTSAVTTTTTTAAAAAIITTTSTTNPSTVVTSHHYRPQSFVERPRASRFIPTSSLLAKDHGLPTIDIASSPSIASTRGDMSIRLKPSSTTTTALTATTPSPSGPHIDSADPSSSCTERPREYSKPGLASWDSRRNNIIPTPPNNDGTDLPKASPTYSRPPVSQASTAVATTTAAVTAITTTSAATIKPITPETTSTTRNATPVLDTILRYNSNSALDTSTSTRASTATAGPLMPTVSSTSTTTKVTLAALASSDKDSSGPLPLPPSLDPDSIESVEKSERMVGPNHNAVAGGAGSGGGDTNASDGHALLLPTSPAKSSRTESRRQIRSRASTVLDKDEYAERVRIPPPIDQVLPPSSSSSSRSVAGNPSPIPRSLADYVLPADRIPAPGPLDCRSLVVENKDRNKLQDRVYRQLSSIFEVNGSSSSIARNSSSAVVAAMQKDGRNMPELQDMIRTHVQPAPDKPTVPRLDTHSEMLRSRPRPVNRRPPTNAQAAIPGANNNSSNSSGGGKNNNSNGSGGATSHKPLPSRPRSRPAGPSPMPPPRSKPRTPASPALPNQCSKCQKPVGETWFRLSDGRQIHPECFKCHACQTAIEDGVYVLEDDREYHPHCVPPSPPIVSVSSNAAASLQDDGGTTGSNSGGGQAGSRPSLFAPPPPEEYCDRCSQVLNGPRFLLSNHKKYHPECFSCAGCGEQFAEGSYVCFEGHEYHRRCVPQSARDTDSPALMCEKCDKEIGGVFVKHAGRSFHPRCFSCVDCDKVITPKMPFGELDDGQPCCEECLTHRVQNGSMPLQTPSTTVTNTSTEFSASSHSIHERYPISAANTIRSSRGVGSYGQPVNASTMRWKDVYTNAA